MGLDIMMLWATTMNEKTGEAYNKAIPVVPEEHRRFLNLYGWEYRQFLPSTDETQMCAEMIYDNMPEWDKIEWESDEYKNMWDEEEYTEWRTAMGWFAKNGFTMTWWW